MQPAYTILSSAIDSKQAQGVLLGKTSVRVTPVSRPHCGTVRITWGARGQKNRQEFQDPEVAKTHIRTLLQSLELGVSLDKVVPSAELQRALVALNALPGVSAESLVAAYRQVHSAHLSGRSVETIANEMIKKAMDSGQSERHVQTLRHHLTNFWKTLRKPLSAVTTQEITSYLSQIPEPKTRNNHRISIISLFNHARKEGDLPYDQASAAKKTTASKVVRKEPDILGVDTLKKLLYGCANPKLKMFLLLGAFAGCRSAEVTRLKWKHITPEGIFLPPEVTKTSRRRIVSVEPNLAAWLKTTPRGKDEEHVSYVHLTALYDTLRELRGDLKVPWVHNGLRHGYVSFHLELYGNPILTSKNTGHSLRELETTYLKLVPHSQAEEWAQIFPN